MEEKMEEGKVNINDNQTDVRQKKQEEQER